MISARVCIADIIKQDTKPLNFHFIWGKSHRQQKQIYANFVPFSNAGVPDPIDNTTCSDYHCENLVPYGNDICFEYVEDPKKFDKAYK